MEVTLQRTYQEKGTNGTVLVNGDKVCHTIELPWHDNERQRSCIPEGSYQLVKRTSAKYGKHILVKNVKDRSLILFHPANDAKTELRGCIAPVTVLTGPGKGIKSRLAFEMLRDLVYDAIDKGNEVILKISKAPAA